MRFVKTKVFPFIFCIILLSMLPAAHAASFQGTVMMKGQYGGGESYSMRDVAKTFSSPDDKLGYAGLFGGLYNSLRTNFVCWSSLPPTADGDIAPGAKIYLASDTISTAFPDGRRGGALCHLCQYPHSRYGFRRSIVALGRGCGKALSPCQ